MMLESTLNYTFENITFITVSETNENDTKVDNGTDISSSRLMEKLYITIACFGMAGMATLQYLFL